MYQQDEVQLDFVHLRKQYLIIYFMTLCYIPGGASLYIDIAL
jgi:hypothetical protein